MSYLECSLYNTNFNTLVENCFNLSIDNEDETLFETSLLLELSTELKMRAAEKSSQKYTAAKSEINKRKAETKTYQKYFPNDNTYYIDANTERDYQHGKRRTRLHKYASQLVSVEDSLGHKIEYPEDERNAYKILAKEGERQKIIDKIKKSWPVQKIKNLLHSLESVYERAKNKITSIEPERRNIFQKVMAKIFHYIEKLRNYIKKKTLKKEIVPNGHGNYSAEEYPVDELPVEELRRQKEELEDLIYAAENKNK